MVAPRHAPARHAPYATGSAHDTMLESADTIAALREKLEAAEAEVQRLTDNSNRFPDLMARILAAKGEPLEPRIERVIAAMQTLRADLMRYQWDADQRPLFGEKRVAVSGNNGLGTGRQYVADTPNHIDGLADYIAAANPDTVAMPIAALTEARAQAPAAKIEGMREAAAVSRKDGFGDDWLGMTCAILAEADARAALAKIAQEE